MCYLVTGNEDDLKAISAAKLNQFDTLPAARTFSEEAALKGVRDVRIWLLTHSVTVQPQAVWTNHAKALSGQE